MSELKAGEVDRFLKSPDRGKALYLVYGPDRGLVSERGEVLARSTGVDLTDSFDKIRPVIEEVKVDIVILAELLHLRARPPNSLTANGARLGSKNKTSSMSNFIRKFH